MFTAWMKNHDFKDYPMDTRLFPLAGDRAYWQQHLGQKEIQAAEALLDCDWPLIRASHYMEYERTGDRLAHETPHFARRHQLIALFLGELAEGKGRFLQDICDGILAICEETFWGVAAHKIYTKQYFILPDGSDPFIDLFAAETAELLAVIYHILSQELDTFCPGIVERMEYELDRRIVIQYLNRSDYHWMGRTNPAVNNWNPWILSNILTVFLVAQLRPSQLRTGLKRMFGDIQRYYDAIPADGGCDEGTSYWTKAAAKLLSFCDQLYIASNGKLDLFDDEKLRNMGLYEEKAYIDGLYVVNFADGNARLIGIHPDYALYAFGIRTGQESLCRLAATLKRQRGDAPTDRSVSIKDTLFSRIYARDIDAQPEFVPEDRYVLPDLQVACMRAGSWFYAAKGGHNDESHNHNDVGNCIVYHKGAPVLVDSGSGVYTKFTFSEARYTIWTMQSGWHNLPVLNGCEQKHGKAFCADHFRTEGKTTHISYGGAYPREAGVQSAQRWVEISAEGVILTDAFSFTGEANSICLHFITPLKPELCPEGVILGGKYLLKTPHACTVEWKDFEGDSKHCTSWETPGLYRIAFCAECGKTHTVKTEIRSL